MEDNGLASHKILITLKSTESLDWDVTMEEQGHE
ncbi:hypothetical protein COMA2_20395 [Candidatus Nitrospira nitrificans]|uniref:Uncharacterized protein n=1 Tax=Candidatus Nitrospira nitrificans TaxID=1742973 RepID=A0A0S4LG47_9BACT|nr:hypothetical protein COMA2_20395 [Candidatus Nitrospira nitrificans]